jgi:hypothetical protein
MAKRPNKAQREAARINALSEALNAVIAAHKAMHETTQRKAAESALDVQQSLIIALALEIWPNCEGDECSEAVDYVMRGLQARVTEIETSFQNERLFRDDSMASAFAEYESEAMH